MAMESNDKIIRNKDTGTSMTRYKKSFCHAIDGIKYAVKNEHNFIIIILAIIVTTLLGFILKINSGEWLFVITSFALVFGSEMLNSAIEAAIDLETNKIHPLAKISKDCGSSATLIFSIMAFIGALIIFIPKIF